MIALSNRTHLIFSHVFGRFERHSDLSKWLHVWDDEFQQ